MDNIVGRLQFLFPPHQLGVIIGSLLGDARLECRSVGLRGPMTARLRIHHGEKQKEYVFWKYEIFKNLVQKEPRQIVWDNPKRNLREVSWYFHTRSLKELGIFHKVFYKHGVKIFPEIISGLITPRALAVWFMDDGSNNVDNCTLNTHGFARDEQVRIQEFLYRQYAVIATIVKDRSKFKLAIGRSQREMFLNIITPFIAPSMTYKIVYPRNDLVAPGDQSEKIGSLSFR
jgi:hypothetical protein